jgi:excinuclease ABC subunit C
MLPVPDAVAAKLPHLPEGPGVYLWKGRDGTTLYVGKAKRLRSRVRSYFANDQLESVKTRHLVGLIGDLDTIVVPSEAHALILEANLIKEYRPRFNIALRDDKSYPYIKVTLQEPFPRVYVTRRLEDDGARYFGPYTDVGAMRRALNVVKRIFTGRPDEVVRRVKERMDLAAEQLDFERAAELRDVLHHLEQMEEPTVVLEVEGGDRDVIGYARDGDDACVTVLRIRGGKLLSREQRFLEHVEGEEDTDVMAIFLAGSYVGMQERARQLLLPFDFPDRELIEQALPDSKIVIPQRGPRRDLIALAEQNARHLLEELKLSSMEADERAGDPVYELGRELGLQRIPRSLVCFDISTTQGTDTVGSLVWFENARAKRSEYRKFKVKTVEGSDDFASIHEVVRRYFDRRVKDEKPLPDLIVIDGGKGQLSAAHAALQELGLADRPLISLAKREEEVFLWGREEPLKLSRRSPALRLLQQARDEAHRFAVTYNRKRRSMRTVTSELLRVPGIGPVKRRQLLKEFGSVQGVRDAGEEAIAKLPGFNPERARKLLESLAATSPV